jgi:hypothetical protein
MFDFLFAIFDIPLTMILIILSFFAIFFVSTVYSLFLLLFISVFVLMFVATTILTQQIFLGELLIISTFFIFAILFFALNSNFIDEYDKIDNTKPVFSKLFLLVFSFVTIFLIIGFNFYRISKSGSPLIEKQSIVSQISQNSTKQGSVSQNVMVIDNNQVYNNYLENIALLNQNKIFQKLTHIIMFYICIVVILYFFNRKGDRDER